jgi:hypothetical protein
MHSAYINFGDKINYLANYLFIIIVIVFKSLITIGLQNNIEL